MYEIDKIYDDDPSPRYDLAGLISAYDQLRPAEKIFVDSYVLDLSKNAKTSGKRILDYMREHAADALHPGREEQIVGYNVNSMMGRPIIRAAITERVRAITEKLSVSAYGVVREVAKLAQSNVADFIDQDENGYTIIDINSATREQLSTIQSIDISYDRFGRQVVKIKMHNKTTALDMMMKYMGLYKQDNEQRTPPMQQTKTIEGDLASDYAKMLDDF